MSARMPDKSHIGKNILASYMVSHISFYRQKVYVDDDHGILKI